MRRLALCLLLLPPLARSGEILDAATTLKNGHYRVSVRARIDAPPGVVFGTITDYANLAAITPSIRSSRLLEAPAPDIQRVETVTVACILIFCKQVKQVQDVGQLGAYHIEAVTLPGVSDLKSGYAHWRLVPAGEGTELVFNQTFEPDFWVPALIGPWMIERLFLREVRATTDYIERLHGGVHP